MGKPRIQRIKVERMTVSPLEICLERGNQGDGSLPEGMPGDLGSLTGGSTALTQVDPATGIAADAGENVFPVGTPAVCDAGRKRRRV